VPPTTDASEGVAVLHGVTLGHLEHSYDRQTAGLITGVIADRLSGALPTSLSVRFTTRDDMLNDASAAVVDTLLPTGMVGTIRRD
jgi:hypothetical protein